MVDIPYHWSLSPWHSVCMGGSAPFPLQNRCLESEVRSLRCIGRAFNGHYSRYIFSDFRSSMIVTADLPHYLRSYPSRSALWCCRWQTVAFGDKLRQTALWWEWDQAGARCPT